MVLSIKFHRAFSLLPTLLIMAVITLLATNLYYLAHTFSQQQTKNYQKIADNHAYFGLYCALAHLQEAMGPDQRISAPASHLQKKLPLSHQNWLSVWQSHLVHQQQIVPIIGKKNNQPNLPYRTHSSLSDLRHTHFPNYRAAQQYLWRSFLVNNFSHFQQKNTAEITFVSAKNLNNGKLRQIVTVPVTKIHDARKQWRGSYAYWISDQNQKAALAPYPQQEKMKQDLFRKPQQARPEQLPILPLSPSNILFLPSPYRDYVHDYTLYNPHLFSNTATGGLKLNLARLSPKYSLLQLRTPRQKLQFDSNNSIIPEAIAGATNYTFRQLIQAINYTNQQISTSQKYYQLASLSNKKSYRRLANIWGQNCRITLPVPSQQGNISPVKPILHRAQWHFAFSQHPNQHIITHITPHLQLWNPYDIALKIPDLLLWLPNPFYRQKSSYINFYLDQFTASKLQYDCPNFPILKHWQPSYHYQLKQHVYTLTARLHNNTNSQQSLLPNSPYLFFIVKAATIPAGKCLLWSPQSPSPQQRQQAYNNQDIYRNILSASSHPTTGQFYFHGGNLPNFRIKIGRSKYYLLPASVTKKINYNTVLAYAPNAIFKQPFRYHLTYLPQQKKALNSRQIYQDKNGNFPTITLINLSNGGVKSWNFYMRYHYFGVQKLPTNGLPQWHPDQYVQGHVKHGFGMSLRHFNLQHEAQSLPRKRVILPDDIYYTQPLLSHHNIMADIITPAANNCFHPYWYNHAAGAWLQTFHNHLSSQLAHYAQQNNNYWVIDAMFPYQQKSSPAIICHLPRLPLLRLINLQHYHLCKQSWQSTFNFGEGIASSLAPYHSTCLAILDQKKPSIQRHYFDWLIGGIGKTSGRNNYIWGAQNVPSSSTQLINPAQHYSNAPLLYDFTYTINHYLWDTFCVIPVLPQHKAMLALKSHTQNEITSLFPAAFWQDAAQNYQQYAFNVNSISLLAWTSWLKAAFWNEQKQGYYLQKQQQNNIATSSWHSLQKISSAQITTLAKHIIAEIKARAPFLSISDFINRRLTTGDYGKYSVLSAALIKSGINQRFENWQLKSSNNNSNNHPQIKRTIQQATSNRGWGTAGFIKQADILANLSPYLTVRGDCFLIRVYGSCIFQKKIKATSYLEAIVRRTVNYVDSRNKPTDRDLILNYNSGNWQQTHSLLRINKKLGRRFKILAVRKVSANHW